MCSSDLGLDLLGHTDGRDHAGMIVRWATVDQRSDVRHDGAVTAASTAIDVIDRRIIDILRTEGRVSWKELADRIALAPSTAADRVRRLEATGVIGGYAAAIDPRALGRDVRAVIDVSLAPGDDPARFEERLRDRDEVFLAAYVTGPADYTIIVEIGRAHV